MSISHISCMLMPNQAVPPNELPKLWGCSFHSRATSPTRARYSLKVTSVVVILEQTKSKIDKYENLTKNLRSCATKLKSPVENRICSRWVQSFQRSGPLWTTWAKDHWRKRSPDVGLLVIMSKRPGGVLRKPCVMPQIMAQSHYVVFFRGSASRSGRR